MVSSPELEIQQSAASSDPKIPPSTASEPAQTDNAGKKPYGAVEALAREFEKQNAARKLSEASTACTVDSIGEGVHVETPEEASTEINLQQSQTENPRGPVAAGETDPENVEVEKSDNKSKTNKNDAEVIFAMPTMKMKFTKMNTTGSIMSVDTPRDPVQMAKLAAWMKNNAQELEALEKVSPSASVSDVSNKADAESNNNTNHPNAKSGKSKNKNPLSKLKGRGNKKDLILEKQILKNKLKVESSESVNLDGDGNKNLSPNVSPNASPSSRVSSRQSSSKSLFKKVGEGTKKGVKQVKKKIAPSEKQKAKDKAQQNESNNKSARAAAADEQTNAEENDNKVTVGEHWDTIQRATLSYSTDHSGPSNTGNTEVHSQSTMLGGKSVSSLRESMANLDAKSVSEFCLTCAQTVCVCRAGAWSASILESQPSWSDTDCSTEYDPRTTVASLGSIGEFGKAPPLFGKKGVGKETPSRSAERIKTKVDTPMPVMMRPRMPTIDTPRLTQIQEENKILRPGALPGIKKRPIRRPTPKANNVFSLRNRARSMSVDSNVSANKLPTPKITNLDTFGSAGSPLTVQEFYPYNGDSFDGPVHKDSVSTLDGAKMLKKSSSSTMASTVHVPDQKKFSSSSTIHSTIAKKSKSFARQNSVYKKQTTLERVREHQSFGSSRLSVRSVKGSI